MLVYTCQLGKDSVLQTLLKVVSNNNIGVLAP